MRPDGSGATRLTFFGMEGHAHFDSRARQITELSWLPDGESLVFGRVSSGASIVDRFATGPRLPSTLYLGRLACAGEAP